MQTVNEYAISKAMQLVYIPYNLSPILDHFWKIIYLCIRNRKKK